MCPFIKVKEVEAEEENAVCECDLRQRGLELLLHFGPFGVNPQTVSSEYLLLFWLSISPFPYVTFFFHSILSQFLAPFVLFFYFLLSILGIPSTHTGPFSLLPTVLTPSLCVCLCVLLCTARSP